MKKLNLFFAVLACSLLFSLVVKAQAPADYFIGKWDLLTTGLPQGDTHSSIVFERNDSKLSGYMIDNKGLKTVFSKIDEKPTNISVYFTASGYDCYIFLEKKDDNNVTGSLMDMFDCSAVRVVETKTESK